MSFFESPFSLRATSIQTVVIEQLSNIEDQFLEGMNFRLQSNFSYEFKKFKQKIIFKEEVNQEQIARLSQKEEKFLKFLNRTLETANLDQSPHIRASIEKIKCIFQQYEQLLTHFAQNPSYDFSQNLSEPWGLEFLFACLKAKNSEAFKFLIQNQKNEKIQNLILTGVECEEEGAVIGFLELSKKSSDCVWAQQKLVHLLETETHPIIQNFFGLQLKQEGHEFHFIFPNWLDWIKQDRSFAVALLSYFYDVREVETYHVDFFKSMLDLALNGDRKLQSYTLIIRALQEGVKDSIENAKKELLGKSLLSETSEIWLHNAERWAHFIKKIYENTYIIGNPHRTFQILSLSISSYVDLHLFFKHGKFTPLPKNQTDFFPEVKAVLFGSRAHENSSHTKIIDEVSKKLSSFGIQLYQGSRNTPSTKEASNLDIDLPLWMRDCVHLSWTPDKKIVSKIPNFAFDAQAAKDYSFLKQKERREQKRYSYGSMGGPSSFRRILQYANGHFQKMGPELENMHMLWSYGEGGNFIFFKDPKKNDALSCIVGQDTVEMTRSILFEELNEGGFQENSGKYLFKPLEPSQRHLKISDDLIKKVFERDYGVLSENIYFVEQPHQFHLDMGIIYVGGGRFFVNNSQEAFELGPKIYGVLNLSDEESRKLLENERTLALKRKELEDRCALDLAYQGFEVVQVPGVFSNPYENSEIKQRVNFFNCLTIKTPSKKVVYATGCPENFQILFESLLIKNAQFDPDEIFYLPQKVSEEYLNLDGGLHCLTQILEHKLDESEQK